MTAPLWMWLIILPVGAAPVIYLAGRVGGQARAARWVALAALGAAWWPFAAAASELNAHGPLVYTVGAVALRLDELGLLLAALALGLGALVTVFSMPALAGEAGEEKYYALLSALVGLMIGLACAADLFNLWVWFEAMVVASYLLVVFHHGQRASLEAGVKYLAQSAAGSALALVGIALVLAQTGTLDLTRIRAIAAPAPMLWAAGALLLVGFGAKAALAPLHTWLPDAHAQAPSGISAMMSGVVIEAGLVALLRALAALAGASASWGALLIGFGALNMLGGNLLALRQTQVKRLLAFSSLSHMGYIVFGLGLTVQTGQAAGAQGGLLHLLNHGLMKGLAFLAIGALLYALHPSHTAHAPLTISDLAGAARRYPLAALALSVAALGLAGLPPLAGFISKWQIFVAGFAAGRPALAWLVIFMALNALLSLAYYAPVINMLYRQQVSALVAGGGPLPAAMTAPLALMAAAVLVVGLWPGLFAWLSDPAGAALLAAFGR